METSILDAVGAGIQEIGTFIHWPFLFFFMIVSYIANTVVKKSKHLRGLAITVSTFWRTLIIGVILAMLFWSMSEVYTLQEVLRYLCSILFAMFILWDGLKKWVKYIKRKLPKLS